MCTGTGETALLLEKAAPAGTSVFAADYSIHMLREFRKKQSGRHRLRQTPVVLADAGFLPFPDQAFQLITTSFATRNLHTGRERLVKTFGEFYRILAPGGRYVSIESSRPANRLIDAIFRGFVSAIVEPVGHRISGTRAGYAYLSKSIRTFYPPADLAGILRNAGFSHVSWRRLFLGAAAVHIAIKSPVPAVAFSGGHTKLQSPEQGR